MSLRTYIITLSIMAASLASQAAPDGRDSLAQHEPEIRQMISFLNYMLNTLGDAGTPYADKETIMYQSYQKLFESAQVQIEDDLDPARKVSLQKDVIAYLKDVDFFYEQVQFTLQVKAIDYGMRSAGTPYAKVTLLRDLQGTSLRGQRITESGDRYVEINIDEQSQSLKIASMYTREVTETEEYQDWWQNLSLQWRKIISQACALPLNPTSSDWERLQKITALDLSERLLLDLSGIAKLKQLEQLNLSQTQVADITPLRHLNHLQTLDLSYTPVSDLSALRFNPRLRQLNLSHCQLSQVEPIAGMKQLKTLQLVHTMLPEGALWLPQHLDSLNAASSNYQNLQSLLAATQLHYLNLSGVPASQFDPIAGLTALSYLNLSHTSFGSTSLLQNMTQLADLDISHTVTDDPTPLAMLPALRSIWCEQTAVSDTAWEAWSATRPEVLLIKETAQLQQWWLQLDQSWRQALLQQVGARHASAEVMSQITRIDSLSVSGGQMTNLRGLQKLKQLHHLRLTDCAITDLSGIEQLRQLHVLSLAGNPVKELWPLAKLGQLRSVNIGRTPVSSLAPLQELSALQVIKADQSQLSKAEVTAFVRHRPAILVISHLEEKEQWWQALSPAWQKLIKERLGMMDPGPEALCQLTKWQSLTLAGEEVWDLTPLAALHNLRSLHIKGNTGFSGEALPALPLLETLRLTEMNVTDWTFLTRYSALQTLDLSNTSFDAVYLLSKLTKLTDLDLSATPVSNIRALRQADQLERLSIANTRVSNLKPLAGLANLRYISCFNTNISRFHLKRYKEQHPGCEIVYY